MANNSPSKSGFLTTSRRPISQNSKGQAAMEFLMTYGWAILVVLVVIAALAYFGVLDPTNILPDRCTFPITFTCTDYVVRGTANSLADDVVSMKLVNNGGKDIALANISAYGGPLLAACSTSTSIINGVPATLGSGSELEITLTGCNLAPSGKKKDKYLVNVSYTLVGSTFAKTLQGELLTKRES